MTARSCLCTIYVFREFNERIGEPGYFVSSEILSTTAGTLLLQMIVFKLVKKLCTVLLEKQNIYSKDIYKHVFSCDCQYNRRKLIMSFKFFTGELSFKEKEADISFPSDFVDDYPVAMQVRTKFFNAFASS